jgi:hypothetical protein
MEDCMAYFEKGYQKDHRWLASTAGDSEGGLEQNGKQVVKQTKHAPLQSSGIGHFYSIADRSA